MYRPPWYSPFEAPMDNPDAPCPEYIRRNLRVLAVPYISFTGAVCSGNLVVHRALTRDFADIFEELFDIKFPIAKIVPISSPRYAWSDVRSMGDNNTSAFNYRTVAGTQKLSLHAFGCAVDINPVQNPYIRDGIAEPHGASYDPEVPGTIVDGGLAVKLFLARGFVWGGHWTDRKDYQHFEKFVAIHRNK